MNIETIKKINRVADSYQKYFKGSIHGILWQCLVAQDNKNQAFTALCRAEGYILALTTENESGYFEMPVAFVDGFLEYSDYEEIAEDLNRDAFDHNMNRSRQIIASSMRGI